jgi:hypothetical protein
LLPRNATNRLFTSPSVIAGAGSPGSGFSGVVRRKAIAIDEVCNVLVKSSKVEISFGRSPLCVSRLTDRPMLIPAPGRPRQPKRASRFSSSRPSRPTLSPSSRPHLPRPSTSNSKARRRAPSRSRRAARSARSRAVGAPEGCLAVGVPAGGCARCARRSGESWASNLPAYAFLNLWILSVLYECALAPRRPCVMPSVCRSILIQVHPRSRRGVRTEGPSVGAQHAERLEPCPRRNVLQLSPAQSPPLYRPPPTPRTPYLAQRVDALASPLTHVACVTP